MTLIAASDLSLFYFLATEFTLIIPRKKKKVGEGIPPGSTVKREKWGSSVIFYFFNRAYSALLRFVFKCAS